MKVINGWAEVIPPDIRPDMPQHHKESIQQLISAKARYYMKGDCRAIFTLEPARLTGLVRQHLSVSCADRLPNWDELKDARYSLMGLGITVVSVLPPSTEYVNIHNFTLHLWEVTKDVLDL